MVDIPFPKAIPFSVCAPSLSHVYCVSAEDLVIEGTRDCNSGETPPLVSASVAYAKKKYTLNGLEVTASLSIWAGVETDLSAIWLGESQGNCARIQIDPPSPTAAIDDIVNDLQRYQGDISEWIDDVGGPSRGTTGNEVLVALVLIVIAIAIAAPPSGVFG